MAPVEKEFIEVAPGVKINVVMTHPSELLNQKELPTIIFLHFWGGSSSTWSLVAPHISPKYPTLAIDFRGWGDSTGPDDPQAYSVVTLTDDLLTIIWKLGLKKVVLVGLSMGAKVAQLAASQLSTSTTGEDGNDVTLLGIILVSPAPPTPLILPPAIREQQLHAYDNKDTATFVAANVLTSTFQSGARSLPPNLVSDMLRGNRWARKAWPAYAMGEDVSEAASRISVPVMVIAADRDVVEPLERVQKEVVARIPGATLDVVAGSGHLSPVDIPGVVSDHIIRFVEHIAMFRS